MLRPALQQPCWVNAEKILPLHGPQWPHLQNECQDYLLSKDPTGLTVFDILILAQAQPQSQKEILLQHECREEIMLSSA